MNHYRWNMLNNVNDLVFVINSKNREIVLKNNLFDELAESAQVQEGVSLDLVMPKKEDCADLLTEVLATLGDDEAAQYSCTCKQVLMHHAVDVQLQAGYFDISRDEVYFVLKGYNSIIEFIRLKKSVAKIPDNIVVLLADDAFDIYCTNEEFERNFSSETATFTETFGDSLVNAMPEEKRETYLAQLNAQLAKQGTASLIIDLFDANMQKHYVILTVKMVKDLLSYAVLCATVQVIDESVEEYLKIQSEHEVYSVASRFNNSVMFRLNLEEMTVIFFGESIDNFDLRKLNGSGVGAVLKHNLVYKDDIETFTNLIAGMKAGKEEIVRMRMNAVDGRHDWYMIEYKIVCDAAGEPKQALGTITNVQKTQELQTKASTDLLTTCMNKGTFEASCMNLLNDHSAEHNHAFLMIDLDNFKAVNDNLGHFFGDIVLKEVATKLKRIFRSSDYIARIGGDEFAVLMKDITDVQRVYEKAEELIHAVDTTYRGDHTSYRISASVGIALYPRQADNYEDIYKRADIALYHAKNTGKNAYTLYDETLEQGTMANTTPFDVANRAFSHFFDQQVAMDTFNLLFETDDSKDAVDMVLRHLGERFDVDRCYIFSAANEECTAYHNTYEWCHEGITPEIENLQNLPYEVFDACFQQANAEGVFYSDDVSTLENDAARETLVAQGIVAMLHTYVKKDGKYRYTLGFDDCSSKRIWKPSEISTLMYASKIIAQFLLYTEAIERAAISAKEQLEVMNNLNFYAYIVDNETHQLHYYNNLTSDILPEVVQGGCCYQVIRGKEHECENCPVKALRESGATKIRSIIYNEKLKMHFLVTASSVTRFAGRASTFVSSTDVTDMIGDMPQGLDLTKFTKLDQ